MSEASLHAGYSSKAIKTRGEVAARGVLMGGPLWYVVRALVEVEEDHHATVLKCVADTLAIPYAIKLFSV